MVKRTNLNDGNQPKTLQQVNEKINKGYQPTPLGIGKKPPVGAKPSINSPQSSK